MKRTDKRAGRLLVLGIVASSGCLWLGSATAIADTVIDTTACTTIGNATLSAPGTSTNVQQNQLGNEFVAPANYLKTLTGELAADGNQSATLALFNADSSGPLGAALWTAPETILGTGSTSTYGPQTFTIDQPLTAGRTYAFALISGAPTATVSWTLAQPSGPACSPGPVVEAYAGQPWFPPLTNKVLAFSAAFATVAPPAVGPASVSFPAQPANTIGDVQTVTITASGEAATTLGQLSIRGADGSDFLLVDDQCSGQTLVPSASCAVGVRFAPQATGDAGRTAALDVPYIVGTQPPAGGSSPPSGFVIDALSGTVAPAPGATGPAGPRGPAGPQGPVGPRGANGEVELVTCTTVTETRKAHGRTQRRTVEQCRTRLVTSPVKFTVNAAHAARLTRAGVLYATGFRSGSRTVLETSRVLRPGRYVLSWRVHGRASRRNVTIV